MHAGKQYAHTGRTMRGSQILFHKTHQMVIENISMSTPNSSVIHGAKSPICI